MKEVKEDLDFAEWQLHAFWKPPGQHNWHRMCIWAIVLST